jgi:hypothetical protein
MRRQGTVIALAIVTGIAGGLIAIVAGFLTVWNCSSGDGGAPFVAPDSPQAGVCSATGDGVLLVVLALAAAVGAAVAAYFAGAAWIRGARPGPAFAGLLALAVLAPIGLIWVANLPSDDCTGESAAAYDAWIQNGMRGEPPSDCETY